MIVVFYLYFCFFFVLLLPPMIWHYCRGDRTGFIRTWREKTQQRVCDRSPLLPALWQGSHVELSPRRELIHWSDRYWAILADRGGKRKVEAMSGQSITDRIAAAQHSMTGSAISKAVCKATTHEVSGPKKKHLDCEYIYTDTLCVVVIQSAAGLQKSRHTGPVGWHIPSHEPGELGSGDWSDQNRLITVKKTHMRSIYRGDACVDFYQCIWQYFIVSFLSKVSSFLPQTQLEIVLTSH